MKKFLHVTATTFVMVAIVLSFVFFIGSQLTDCKKMDIDFGTGNTTTICVYDDNSFCFTDETDCEKGMHFMKCDLIGTFSEGWYSEEHGLLKWDTCVNKTSPFES